MAERGTGRTVVVGVDGSQPALRAVAWAAPEAVRRGVPLRLVLAFGWPTGHHVGQPDLGIDAREALLRGARAQLAEAAEVAQATAPGVEVERQLVVGFPIAVLEAESTRAQLLVVGDRGLGGVAGLLLGSVAVALAAHADAPVVVARGAGDGGARGAGDGGARRADGRPVVVGIDGSPTSEAALAFAYDAAAARRVPLVAVHTWWDLLVDPALAPLLDWAAIEADEHQVLAERLAGWGQKYPDVPVRRVVCRDRPARRLLEQAADAQLVVVGSRGRGAVRGLLLGSVSHALLHHSPCPVAVVRTAEDTGPGR